MYSRTVFTEPLEIAGLTTLWPTNGEGSYPTAETAAHFGSSHVVREGDCEAFAAIRIRDTWNACHGLDLPADVEPGLLAEVVTALRDAIPLLEGSFNQPERRAFAQAILDVLAKLQKP